MSKPSPGCAILLTCGVVFTLLAIWAAYTGYQQNKAIDGFSVEKPVELPGSASSPEAVAALRQRVRTFGVEIRQGKPARLELSAQDLNDLILHEDKLFDYRKLIRFTGVGETLEANVSLPLRTLFRGGAYRYLNGAMRLAPKIDESFPSLEVRSVLSKHGQIPEGFARSFSANFVPQAGYREDAEIGPALRNLTKFAVEAGKLVLERK